MERFHGETLQERLRARLQNQAGQTGQTWEAPATSALLLDTSGSMREAIGANVRKIDELRKLAGEFAGVRQFHFGSTCAELKRASVPEPAGGTAMDIAFLKVKQGGVLHVVLITDGKPDSAARAIEASRGLKIDVLYVGPDPAPQFLQDLCAQTGGQYGKASFSSPKELAGRVRALLPAPKGAIQL